MPGNESNSAILEFLMNDKKEEGEKKKQDEERRQEERKEDAKRMENFRYDIIKTVKNEIKSEVKEAIEPLKVRQEKTEKEAEETNVKEETIRQDMKELKAKLDKIVENGANSSENRGTLKDSVGEAAQNEIPKGWRSRCERLEEEAESAGGMEDKSVKLLRNAKRVLGFKPIDKAHVQKCMGRVKQNSDDCKGLKLKLSWFGRSCAHTD